MYVYVCIYIHKHRLRTDVLNLADNTKPMKVNKAEGKQEETPFKTDNATMKKEQKNVAEIMLQKYSHELLDARGTLLT